MRESAMVRKTERRTAETAQHVEIGSLRRQSQRQCGEGRFTVETGAPQTRPGQKVCDRFQSCSLP